MKRQRTDELMRNALSCRDSGRLAEAESAYREVLGCEPDHAEAWHMLGVLAGQTGQPALAVKLIEKSLQLDPTLPDPYNNLGNVLEASGRLDEASRAYRRALEIHPSFPEARFNLGNLLAGRGDLLAAAEEYRRAIELRPDFEKARNRLALTLQTLAKTLREEGNLEQSVAACAECVALLPGRIDVRFELALALQLGGRLDDAIACYRALLEMDASHSEIFQNLGNALHAKGDLDEAAESYRAALRLCPQSAEIWSNLGAALQAKGLLDEAIEACAYALRLDPNFAPAHSTLGYCFCDAARIDEGVAAHRRAVELAPDSSVMHSNLVYALNFHPDADARAILREARQWEVWHGRLANSAQAPIRGKVSADRPLRIGYVSPDFRRHVVGWNLIGLIRRHDRERFKIYCYADVPNPDALTAEFRSSVDAWRDIAGVSDEQAAQMIRNDEIDILVDLTLHMARNRLRIFAQKPAPVQVTYLGYCGTTGMAAMDYRISDPFLDPPGTDLSVYSEETIRLPRSYWGYEPAGPTPEISPLPALGLGWVTFGCLNNFSKVSASALNLWLEILAATAGSRLLLYAPEGACRTDVLARAASRQIAAERLEFVGRQSWSAYVRTWGRIDIALDPFPYGGGITSCDALWMGVPLVTLSGATAVGRGGRSILSNLGLSELVAETSSEYHEIATSLACDLLRLSEMRSTLRSRMENSALRAFSNLAKDLESVYRQMWEFADQE